MCITVTGLMLLQPDTKLMPIHVAIPGTWSASCRQRPEYAERTNDATSGV